MKEQLTKREILQRIRKILWDHLEYTSCRSHMDVSVAMTGQALKTIVRIDQLLDDPMWECESSDE